jgi:hypothetical protein
MAFKYRRETIKEYKRASSLNGWFSHIFSSVSSTGCWDGQKRARLKRNNGMRRPLFLLLVGIVLILFAMLYACAGTSMPKDLAISGIVLNNEEQPITGAVVRIKATDIATTSDDQGGFILTDLSDTSSVFVTAWASGYYINGVEDIQPGDEDVRIILHAHHTTDNPDYTWLPSTFHEGQGENQGCAQCHSSAGTDLVLTLPADEWLLDAHSQSATNSIFLTMYSGTDMDGSQSPFTRYSYSRDYGRFPLPPDLTQPYYGPGYKLDFPETTGNCAACHLPAAAIDDAYGIDPATVSGTEADGISCDFCHKVWDVQLNPDTGLPYANMPGVLSFVFLRPPEGHQFFAGPLDDVAPGEDTFSPIQNLSQFCASCHYGTFWDTTIYNSFGEWLESPYSEPGTGRTCQDCHMPHTGATYFALPGEGGTERNPETIFSHLMPGASSIDLLQNAVTMSVDTRREGDDVIVEVVLVNDKTGHDVPTDSPLRQVILLVSATDGQGQPLVFRDGPTIPEWGGMGDASQGYYGGLPGKGYAKILMEIWTGITPSGAYWNPTSMVSDNRIPAFGTDTSTYTFAAPADDVAQVKVSLFYRRTFKQLMDWKSWDIADILMEQQTIRVEK